MIIFEKISIKNFFSVGNAPIVIDYKEGLHYITGRDTQTGLRNGVGKSVLMVDSILFALYGKTLRKSTSNIVNNKNGKHCVVILDFKVDGKHYKIERGLAPSFLRFIKYDETVIELSSKNETQHVINDVIKIDLNTCKNMLIMSINATKPFMSMVKIEKRKFIEKILNIDILGTMFWLINDDYNKLRAKKKNLEGKFELLSKHFSRLKEQNKKLKFEIDNFENEKQQKIDFLMLEKSSLEHKIADFEIKDTIQLRQKLEDLRKNQITFHTIMERTRIQIKTINAEVKKLKTIIEEIEFGDICPLCGTKLTIEHKNKELSKLGQQEKNLIKDITQYEKQYKQYKEAQPRIIHQIELLRKNIKTIEVVNNNIITTNEKITIIKQQVINEKERILNITLHDLTEIQTDDIKLRNELLEINENFKYTSLEKSIFSDEGIKTFVVKQILPILNAKVKYYLERMGINIWIEFDDELKERIIQKSRQTLPYDNFSAGEQKRVDLALLLAFIDIARTQGRNATNLLVLDEIYDTSLDQQGIELFMEIIREKCTKEKMAIYIVSHQKEYNADIFNSIYILEKSDGFTRIKNIF